jgi:hypothetical protein
MPTLEHSAGTFAKQRQRVEINAHIQDFLLKGGRIQVLHGLCESHPKARVGQWPTRAVAFDLPGTVSD